MEPLRARDWTLFAAMIAITALAGYGAHDIARRLGGTDFEATAAWVVIGIGCFLLFGHIWQNSDTE